MGEIARGRPAGLINFTLKDGQKTVGKFAEEQTVANNFRLKDMREYTSNPSLTFPFRVGMPVKLLGLKQARAYVQDFSYMARIAIGGPDGPGTPILLEDLEGKQIPNLDGESVSATVKSFSTHNGIATFVRDGGDPILTHFDVQKVLLNGTEVPQSVFKRIVYEGMTIPLKVASSVSRAIPGVYYTAKLVLDLLSESEGEEALQEPEEFRGVVVKTESGKPVLLSCNCKGGEEGTTRNFFVVCESVTVDGSPVSESSLDFCEGTSVVVLLRFKHKYPSIEAGRVYSALVDMPLKTGTVKKLIYVRGIAFPRAVMVIMDGKLRQILIQRSGIKVQGGPPTQSFPKDFFKVNMQVQLNDVWVFSKINYRATINVSTNILTKEVQLVDTAIAQATAKAQKDAQKANCAQGVVCGIRKNAEGLVLPSEVTAVIKGKEHKVTIPPDQVLVNNKADIFLPPSMVYLGSKVKVYNLTCMDTTQNYEGKVLYFMPKAKMTDLYSAKPKK